MFFFVIVGAKEVVRTRAEGCAEVRFCPRCGEPKRFRPAVRRNHLTLFFVPVLPLGSARSCLACESCNLCVPLGPHWTGNTHSQ